MSGPRFLRGEGVVYQAEGILGEGMGIPEGGVSILEDGCGYTRYTSWKIQHWY